MRAYHHTYGLPTLITNCSNNYGPYQFPEKLIPLMILNALEGKPLPVYGDGQNVRDWLFVEDHCRALRLVAEKGAPGETYNIGGNSERANLDVVKLICRIVDHLRPGATGRREERTGSLQDGQGQAVERADLHAGQVGRALLHLPAGPDVERHQADRARVDADLADQEAGPLGQHPGLPRAGWGDDASAAADVAVATLRSIDAGGAASGVEEILLVAFDEATLAAYEALFG